MIVNTDSALDNLTRMVQYIGRDRKVQEWFSALADKSDAERRNEIYTTSERMQAEGKDLDLVVSFRLLADPSVFSAARVALETQRRGR